MTTKLLRRLRWRTATLLTPVLSLVLCLGVLAPATTAAATQLPPKIGSFSPVSGAVGAVVTVTGSNFTGGSAVNFNGVPSVFTVDSPSQITATVPYMPGSTGPITVTTPAGTATSPAGFTVIPAVFVSVDTGPPTTSVYVSGNGFGVSEGVDIFFDTTDLALAGTGATGSFGPILVTVPASAIPGLHYISAEGRHSGLFGQGRFTVSTNWAQFRYSRKHKGTNPVENVLSASNVSQIDLDWSFTTGGHVYSSPAVVNGVVYVGSFDSNVYALDAATGGQLWSFTTGGSVESSPAVVNGVVYVGSQDGDLYALDAATGAQLWRSLTNGAIDSSPAVVNGVVYVGSEDGEVLAFNAATGAKLWHFPASGNVFSSPAVVNGVVYVGSDVGNVYALNAVTGRQLWSAPTGFPGNAVLSSPAVASGVVYVGSEDHNVYALSAATGAQLWSFTTGGSVESSPAVAGGVVYVGSDDGRVYALHGGTAGGAALWVFPTAGIPSAGAVESSPAVANGVVYVGAELGGVYALDAATGAQLWSYPTGSVIFSSPAVANGVVYVGTAFHNLYAFDLAGGQAAPARPTRSSLHPDYSLRLQQ
jgi:outer membrane protein assembly factor BamB